MILSDETRPTDYTFANRVAAHVQTDQDLLDGSTPDELAQTIPKSLVVGQLRDIIWHCTSDVYHFTDASRFRTLMALL